MVPYRDQSLCLLEGLENKEWQGSWGTRQTVQLRAWTFRLGLLGSSALRKAVCKTTMRPEERGKKSLPEKKVSFLLWGDTAYKQMLQMLTALGYRF